MKNLIDSGTVLDHALFQLTPTRTRCDLVIYAGKKSEKIASGLLDPFLSHLKSAKDQISRGGYSITLQPPPSDDASSWFTKATLNRFVRFVNTPEILERFVSIDKEIGQIEKEIDINGLANGTLELQGPDGDDAAAEADEKPKVRLQRVLKSRKAILEKELAMAYARALVAGFEMDYLQDLASFSDAFGAQRLREACLNFMEICNRKNNDKIWMDEVAAVQASYIGSTVTMAPFENTDSVTGQRNMDPTEGTENASSVEVPQHTGMPTWRNSFPPQYGPYPMFPQMPPSYPGYMFPGFQVPPSQYPPNMVWPGSFQNSSANSDRHTKKKKKDRNGDNIESESSDEQDEEQRLSATEEPSRKKKPSRRSSGKVVIRNINFIAGGRKDDSDGYSSVEEEYVDADSIKQHVEAAVGSLRRDRKAKSKKDGQRSKNHSEIEDVEPPHSEEEEKKDGNWDVFQNFLMKDSESKAEDTASRTLHAEQGYGEVLNKRVERKFGEEDFIFTERATGSRVDGADVRFEAGEVVRGVIRRSNGDDLLAPNRHEGDNSQNAVFGSESTVIRPQKEEDWLAGSKTESSASRRLPGLDQSIIYNNHLQIRDGEKDVMDDSFMVQTRPSSDGTKQTHPKADIFIDSDIVGRFKSEISAPPDSQTPKFSEPEDLYMINRNDSANVQVAGSWTPEMDYGNGNTVQKIEKEDVAVASTEKPGKKVAAKDPKSKAPPGYLGRSRSAAPTRSSIIPSAAASSRNRINSEDERRKRMEELLIQRQKRIAERSASRGAATENPKTAPKTQTNKNSASEKAKPQASVNALHRNLTRSSTMDRLATPRTITKLLSSESRVRSSSTSRVAPASKNTTENREKAINPTDKKTSKDAAKKPSSKAPETDFGTMKDLHTVTSVEKKETEAAPASDMKNTSIQVISDDTISSQDTSVTTDPSPVTVNTTATASGTSLNPKTEPEKKKVISFSPDISVMDTSTPIEANAELANATPRKKWGDGENSPKAPKGFRKLLLFGRKS